MRLVDQLLDQSDRRIVERPDRFAAAGTVDGPLETKRAIADAELTPTSRTIRLRKDIVEIVTHPSRVAHCAKDGDAARRPGLLQWQSELIDIGRGHALQLLDDRRR